MTDILQVWQDSFQTLLNPTGNNSISETQNEINESDGSYLNEHISLEELIRAIRSLKNNKASGIDEIPGEVLKNPKLVKFLLTLFNKCFETGMVPDIWSKTIINPIPKSSTADSRDPSNYRSIALVSIQYTQKLLQHSK